MNVTNTPSNSYMEASELATDTIHSLRESRNNSIDHSLKATSHSYDYSNSCSPKTPHTPQPTITCIRKNPNPTGNTTTHNYTCLSKTSVPDRSVVPNINANNNNNANTTCNTTDRSVFNSSPNILDSPVLTNYNTVNDTVISSTGRNFKNLSQDPEIDSSLEKNIGVLTRKSTHSTTHNSSNLQTHNLQNLHNYTSLLKNEGKFIHHQQLLDIMKSNDTRLAHPINHQQYYGSETTPNMSHEDHTGDEMHLENSYEHMTQTTQTQGALTTTENMTTTEDPDDEFDENNCHPMIAYKNGQVKTNSVGPDSSMMDNLKSKASKLPSPVNFDSNNIGDKNFGSSDKYNTPFSQDLCQSSPNLLINHEVKEQDSKTNPEPIPLPATELNDIAGNNLSTMADFTAFPADSFPADSEMDNTPTLLDDKKIDSKHISSTSVDPVIGKMPPLGQPELPTMATTSPPTPHSKMRSPAVTNSLAESSYDDVPLRHVMSIDRSVNMLDEAVRYARQRQLTVKASEEESKEIESSIKAIENKIETLRTAVIEKKQIVYTSDVNQLLQQLQLVNGQINNYKFRIDELVKNARKEVSELETSSNTNSLKTRTLKLHEEFIEKQLDNLESHMRRSKHMSQTLFTLKRLASVQEARLKANQNQVQPREPLLPQSTTKKSLPVLNEDASNCDLTKITASNHEPSIQQTIKGPTTTSITVTTPEIKIKNQDNVITVVHPITDQQQKIEKTSVNVTSFEEDPTDTPKPDSVAPKIIDDAAKKTHILTNVQTAPLTSNLLTKSNDHLENFTNTGSSPNGTGVRHINISPIFNIQSENSMDTTKQLCKMDNMSINCYKPCRNKLATGNLNNKDKDDGSHSYHLDSNHHNKIKEEVPIPKHVSKTLPTEIFNSLSIDELNVRSSVLEEVKNIKPNSELRMNVITDLETKWDKKRKQLLGSLKKTFASKSNSGPKSLKKTGTVTGPKGNIFKKKSFKEGANKIGHLVSFWH